MTFLSRTSRAASTRKRRLRGEARRRTLRQNRRYRSRTCESQNAKEDDSHRLIWLPAEEIVNPELDVALPASCSFARASRASPALHRLQLPWSPTRETDRPLPRAVGKLEDVSTAQMHRVPIHSIELDAVGHCAPRQVIEPLTTPLVVLTTDPVVGELLGRSELLLTALSTSELMPRVTRNSAATSRVAASPRAGRRAVRPRARHGRARPPARARARCRHHDGSTRRRVRDRHPRQRAGALLPCARCAATHTRVDAHAREHVLAAREERFSPSGGRRPSVCTKTAPRATSLQQPQLPDPGLRRTDPDDRPDRPASRDALRPGALAISSRHGHVRHMVDAPSHQIALHARRSLGAERGGATTCDCNKPGSVAAGTCASSRRPARGREPQPPTATFAAGRRRCRSTRRHRRCQPERRYDHSPAGHRPRPAAKSPQT